MKNNETTKKERIINGVLIAAGIGAATYIGVNLFKQELAIRALDKRLDEIGIDTSKQLEQLRTIRECLTMVGGE